MTDNTEMTGEERRLANLRPAKPGEVRNPAGKPKGTLNRKTLFAKFLEQAALAHVTQNQSRALGEDHKPETIAEQIVAAQVIKALAGDLAATTLILDSGIDVLTTKTEITGELTISQALDEVDAGHDLPKLDK